MDNYKIDFVVTWLDSSDSEWKREYNKYKGITSEGDQTNARFRDWDVFKYWFRAVENYAPWVNKVFLITNGTFPKWINKEHPKLVLVKHSDYIPEKFLPTFNSCTIELHMNKIEGLSEHFVYFNDDVYINAPITPEYYFRKGLPCDWNAESFFNVPQYNPTDRFNILISMLVDIGVLNAHFDRRKVCMQSPKRWLGLHLREGWLLSLFLLLYRKKNLFIGFNKKHAEQPYLKSIFEDVWDKEPDMLEESCTRFREDVILNPYIFRYWQFASNKFYPVRNKCIKAYRVTEDTISAIIGAIQNKHINSLCINDTPFCTDDEFVRLKDAVHQAFDKKFPQRSSYEV